MEGMEDSSKCCVSVSNGDCVGMEDWDENIGSGQLRACSQRGSCRGKYDTGGIYSEL